ncbi:NAD-dependent epimerase [Clostridium thermosuccinogenes]|uniref:NAD-dependent epimerase n=1 Tax=Clostridium thermosuccinogenes TaxID=84032 RepID=A0A2K2FK09_9CLOT|nr:NAD-dependent epimerase/dehydratase family protein [Pseudoclostridium thermosuccinogenes]AUS95172.1 NAD-dependent epimerase [Pseudoclostridium thermosuccinogenes]PNT99108.1 NAD-dependent epimerase [Pseudoclostridium thermosuccinogenes]PNU00912.1 NAD-dependent epimerase [Pseudoclostridium thermosuccinogenes]
MKKILITGANSYIGTSFEKWVAQWPDKYSVDTVDMIDGTWKEKDFSGYDVVFHVAGIVHVKEKNTSKYFEVNRDLAVDVAEKAKSEGVKQFIFLSTMGVYGTETGYITEKTLPDPKTPYAKSKYEAEKLLLKMNEDSSFKVAVLRPPIVYGKGCKGNYPRLARLAVKLPIFPDVNNERSMIYIDNLSEFTRLLIEYCAEGLFFPQNKDYVNTTELVRLIAKSHNKEIRITKFFNFAISIGFKMSETLRKVFGSCVYDKKMIGYHGTTIDGWKMEYETVSFEESIKLTES